MNQNKLDKIYNSCLSLVTFFGVIALSMIVLKIPAVQKLLSPATAYTASGIWLWIVMWVIIALECSVIPGPYIPFMMFFAATPLATDKALFWGVCTSAVVVGRIGAYFVGKRFGDKLFMRSSAESYLTWRSKLLAPTGKAFYAVTVAAPGFPDFVLAIIAGSIRMDFWFYMLINTACKAIENWLLIYLGVIMGAGGNLWFYIYLAVIGISFITAVSIRISQYYKHKYINK